MAKNAIFNTVEEAIEDFREGRIVIVVDDEDRENEGDFIHSPVHSQSFLVSV